MADTSGSGGVKYAKQDSSYFEKRGLQRYAGIWSLWALGVGAVISGHFSGWNFGFGTGGWGGMLVAGVFLRHLEDFDAGVVNPYGAVGIAVNVSKGFGGHERDGTVGGGLCNARIYREHQEAARTLWKGMGRA